MTYGTKGCQVICAVLIAAVIWAGVGPSLAEAAMRPAPPRAVPTAPSTDFQFDSLLADIQQTLQQGRDATLATPKTGLVTIEQLRGQRKQLQAEDKKVRAYFADLEAFLLEKQLSEEILARHRAFVAEYEGKYAALQTYLDLIERAQRDSTSFWGQLTGRNRQVDWSAVLNQTAAFLDANTHPAPKSHFDPHNLPHRSLRAEQPIPPKLTAAEWQAALPEMATTGKPPGLAAMLPNSPYLNRFDAPPTAEDLAETIEVQFTPEITQLAADLGNNPVHIYNWVHNNVEFVPIWGSIQGAQLCLETRNCNAFDTSSLLIALLRVSGIPARYQMGTIEVPVDKAMNWLGGFTDPAAAARFVASGGTPSAGTVQHGGVIDTLRMEHIWVMGYLDYIPSQGNEHVQGDTWVSLDASFKLFEYSPGDNLVSRITFDPENVFEHLIASADFNLSDASVSNIDMSFVSKTHENLVSELETILPPENLEGAALDTLPSSRPIWRDWQVNLTSAPYTILATGPIMNSIAKEFRHSITISLTDYDGNVLLSFEATLPELARKSISLVYEPATQTDSDIIMMAAPSDFLIDPDPNTVVQRIMKQIPAQLVNVRSVLHIDGMNVIVGEPTQMGYPHLITVSLASPTVSTPNSQVKAVAWGHYGITLNLSGVSYESLQMREAENKKLVTEYQPGDDVSLIASTSRDLILLTWFRLVDRWSGALGRAAGVRFARYPSLGFTYTLGSVIESFGTPITVNLDNFVIDVVQQLQVNTPLNGDTDLDKVLMVYSGFLASYLEGQVGAKFFPGPESTLNGISAASALWAASEQNIPLHSIDSSNVSRILPLIDSGYDSEAIADRANLGQIIFIAQQPPLVDGYQVYSYIAIDPDTGDGAFLINDAFGNFSKTFCGESATRFEDCPAWFVTTIEMLFMFSTIALIGIATPLAVIAVVDGAIVAVALPNLFPILMNLAIFVEGAGSEDFLDSFYGCMESVVDLDIDTLACLGMLMGFMQGLAS